MIGDPWDTSYNPLYTKKATHAGECGSPVWVGCWIKGYTDKDGNYVPASEISSDRNGDTYTEATCILDNVPDATYWQSKLVCDSQESCEADKDRETGPTTTCGSNWVKEYTYTELLVKNEWTGFEQWMPDNSHNVPQSQKPEDRETLLDRRGGRFCTEGCGCITTDGSSLSGAQTILPQQLAITVTKEKGGRWDARNNIWSGDGYTLHLKYSNGAWRGRACCSKIPNGNYCDPCKTTTMHSSNNLWGADFLPSDCHYANNAYDNSGNKHEPNGEGFFHGEFLHSNDQQELILDEDSGLWKRTGGYDRASPHFAHPRVGEEDWKPYFNYREILGFDEDLIAYDDRLMKPLNYDTDPLVNSRTSSILPIARLDKACIADGFTPEKKNPWCRNPIYGTRVKIQDKSECIADGIESEDTQYCVDSEDNKKTALNKTECLSLLDEGYHWKDNESLNYEWVDWEYEKQSCCGKSILDSNHPSRTPQMVGVDSPDSENSVCFTPHLEAVLTAPTVSVNNQKDRETFLLDTEHYWTLVIRPCNFWKSCSEEGISGTKSSEGSHDDYDWGTGCGEEIILNIPANQILNDSNFNLTLSDRKTPFVGVMSTNIGYKQEHPRLSKRSTDREYHTSPSRWREPQPMWNFTMGDLMGNPADMLFNSNWPGAIAGPFPGDAINGNQWSWWCNNPDANKDGIADGVLEYQSGRGSDGEDLPFPELNQDRWHENHDRGGFDYSGSHCSQWAYYDKGEEGLDRPVLYEDYTKMTNRKFFGNILNPKGADRFYGFNLQPQPFKAAEERQNRVKSLESAAIDHRHWNLCANHTFGLEPGFSSTGGNWFLNYGPDYFLYYDFLQHDEISVSGSGGIANTSVFPTDYDEDCVEGGGTCSKKRKGSCDSDRPDYCDRHAPDYCDKSVPAVCDTVIEEGCWVKGLTSSAGYEPAYLVPNDHFTQQPHTQQTCVAASTLNYWQRRLVCPNQATCKGKVDREQSPAATCGGDWVEELVCLNKEDCLDKDKCGSVGAEWVRGEECLTQKDCEDKEKCGANGATWKKGSSCNNQDDCTHPEQCNGKWTAPTACEYESTCINPKQCDGVWTPAKPCPKQGECEKVSIMARKYVDSHVGFLTNSTCGFSNWAGWYPFDSEFNDFSCPACSATDEHKCSQAGTCEHQDGTFEHANRSQGCGDKGKCYNDLDKEVEEATTEVSCNEKNYTWKPVKPWRGCCSWSEECDQQIGFMDPETGTGGWRDAVDKEECEKSIEDGGADGVWNEGCAPTLVTTECLEPVEIPEDFADIVFGDQIGKCTLYENDSGEVTTVVKEPITKTECSDESEKDKHRLAEYDDSVLPDSTFEAHRVGVYHGYEGYPLRENSLIKQRPLIKEDIDASWQNWNAMDYWAETGLIPKPEIASYVNNTCVGTVGSGRISYASNDVPVQITSPEHKLRDGDLVDVKGVLGNFVANVMSLKEKQAIQWEDTLYKPCVGESCDNITWPDVICPYESKCQDSSGNEIPNKTPLSCSTGECVGADDKEILKDDGKNCLSEKECLDAKGSTKPLDNKGGCPDGYSKTVKEPGKCINAFSGETVDLEERFCTAPEFTWTSAVFHCSKNGPAGCGGAKWINPGTWVEFCDKSKYFACDGTVVQGEDPDPAPFFVVKNTTIDTFDLYTCDKTPIDGQITNRINLSGDLECETEDIKMACISNYGISTYEKIIEKALYKVVPVLYMQSDVSGSVELPTMVDIGEGSNFDESTCSKHGTCSIIADALTKDPLESFISKEECTELAKVFSELHPKSEYTDTKQKYTTACFDLNGDRDNSQELLNNIFNFEDFSKVCKAKHTACIIDGKVDPNLTEAMCSVYDGKWQEPTVSNGLYNECVVDGTNFDKCWSAGTWADERSIAANSGGVGKYGGSVYKVCPFTGEWITYTQDIVPEYMVHQSPSSFNIEYRESFGGISKRSESDANDYYVQIEQKGICPVCCDHFMPEKLTATLNPESSEILNLITCPIDPCFEPRVCLDPLGNILEFDKYSCKNPNVWIEDYNDAIIGDGFCCSDTYHGCNLLDLEACKANPELFGICKDSEGVTLVAHTKDECENSNGTFYPLSRNSNGKTECELFLRKRLNEESTTNCRKCSKVYSEQNKLPMRWKNDPDTGSNGISKNALVSKNNRSCCASGENGPNDDFNSCDCTPNINKFPKCEEFINIAGDCNLTRLLGVVTIGELTGTCEVYFPMSGGTESGGIYYWAFDPCSCFPNNVAMHCETEKVSDTNVEGLESCKLQTGKDYYDNPDSTGCGPRGSTLATANASCYDYGQGMHAVNNTCPGLTNGKDIAEDSGYCLNNPLITTEKDCKDAEEIWMLDSLLDVDLEYDGTVWRSEWTLMQRVGTKQCLKLSWPVKCQVGDEGGDSNFITPINSDCDGCDLPQSIRRGVWNRSNGKYRDIRPPRDPVVYPPTGYTGTEDGHFIRLIMGCGNAIPSIEDGELKDGGFGPGPHSYNNNGIRLWAEITNCTFHDDGISETLRGNRVIDGVSGSPPCFPNYLGCNVEKKDKITVNWPSETEGPSNDERKYAFVGTCVTSRDCGPKGPCWRTKCCTYEGVDKPLHNTGPLWSGAVACSTGGDIAHKCQTIGFDPTPQKQSETFTVYDIIDVNHKTGEGTLVVNAYPFTGNGRHCSYSAGTTISVGLADLQDAESDTLGSSSRNNKPKNPYLRGTVLKSPIKDGESVLSEFGASEGRKIDDRNEYMLIEVDDVTQFITKNPRKNRHLKYGDIEFGRDISKDKCDTKIEEGCWKKGYDGSDGYESAHLVKSHFLTGKTHTQQSCDDEFGPTGYWQRSLECPNKATCEGEIDREQSSVDTCGGKWIEAPSFSKKESNKLLPHPFGINPYPVGTQTRSGTSKSEMWPKGKVLSNNLESLRTMGDIDDPGRSGVRWSIENSLEFGKKKALKITGFKNYYKDLGGHGNGYCVGNPNLPDSLSGEVNPKNICIDSGYVWLPDFLFTHVDTNNDFKDFEANEKLLISSTISYRATCKGSRMGYCDIDDGSGKGLNINECTEQNGKWVQVINDYPDGDKTLCEAFGGKWIIGIRNDDMVNFGEHNTSTFSNVYVDPNNDKPKDLERREKDFEDGCPIGCQLRSFYSENACSPMTDDSPEGECSDCIIDEEGELVGCPLSPIDGSHIVSGNIEMDLYSLKRLNERVLNETRDARLLDFYGLKTGFVISDETHITINDEGITDNSSKFENYLLSKDAKYGYGDILFGIDSIFGNRSDDILMEQHKEYIDATKKCKESEECITEQVYVACKNTNGVIQKGRESVLTVNETEFCLSAGGQLVPNFKCIASSSAAGQGEKFLIFDGSDLDYDPKECLVLTEDLTKSLEIKVKGVVLYDVYFNTPSVLSLSPTSTKNTSKNMELAYHDHNPDLDTHNPSWPASIYHWGITKRKWKGVIHITEVEDLDMSDKDKKAYTTYLDRDEGKEEGGLNEAFWDDPYSYWTRHGGAFDVIVGTPAPENNCRDHNSDKPVNLDFWLDFPQICCNSRGPMSYHECSDNCYPDHYDGPVFEDLELAFGISGNSVIHCNIHETVVEEGE